MINCGTTWVVGGGEGGGGIIGSINRVVFVNWPPYRVSKAEVSSFVTPILISLVVPVI